MESFVNAMNGPVLLLIPEIGRWVIWALATFCYLLQPRFALRFRFLNSPCYRCLALVAVAFSSLFAGLLTWVQYFVSLSDPLGQRLLPPYQSWTYFIFSTFQRYWLGIVIGIVVALAFYFFLKALQKYRSRFFEEGETELGLVLALIVGWPAFVVFLPFALAFVVLLSIIRGVFVKQPYTTLGFPMILAAGVTLFWSAELFSLFNLSVLQVCLSCLRIQ